MRALPALLLALVFAGPARADDETPPVQRYLMNLQLGDVLKEVQIVYPPLREWPSFREPGGVVTRYHVERNYAKYFPGELETLSLGLHWGRVVHIQAIFDGRHTKNKPLEQMVVELSLIYGEPRRTGMTYYWDDGRTLLRAFNSEIKTPDGRAVEIRTTLEIMDSGVRRLTR